MDPALSRLVTDPACTLPDASTSCRPDRAAYHKLVNQWGFALAPHSAYEARTTGLSGFQLSLVGAFTAIDSRADYWRRGTRGALGVAADGSVSVQADPDAWLQLYSLELRKGFGFGIEAAGSLGVMPNTQLVAWGADLRIALLEGMRSGVLRYFPDTSVGLGLRQAAGLADLELGTLALDARVSQPLVGPSGFIVTPWVGYQFVRIDAESGGVDLTPDRDALAECGYVGPNLPGTREALGGGASGGEGAEAGSAGAGSGSSDVPVAFDGTPVCSAGSAADVRHAVSFGEAEILRHRLLLGLSYRKELLRLGAELITDLIPADAAQADAATEAALRCDAAGENCQSSPRQWTVVVQVGAAF